MIKLSFPEVKPEASRPSKCRYCGSYYLHVHGHHLRKPKDIRLKELRVTRYRCSCQRTFRAPPHGVEARMEQTKRTIFVSLVLYLLGLSLRGILEIWTDRRKSLVGQMVRSFFRR